MYLLIKSKNNNNYMKNKSEFKKKIKIIFCQVFINQTEIMLLEEVSHTQPKLVQSERLRLPKVIQPTYRLHIGARVNAALRTHLLTLYRPRCVYSFECHMHQPISVNTKIMFT